MTGVRRLFTARHRRQRDRTAASLGARALARGWSDRLPADFLSNPDHPAPGVLGHGVDRNNPKLSRGGPVRRDGLGQVPLTCSESSAHIAPVRGSTISQPINSPKTMLPTYQSLILLST